MKKVYMTIVTLFLILLTFSACSKEPSEPYYDRANNAANKAHYKLSKD